MRCRRSAAFSSPKFSDGLKTENRSKWAVFQLGRYFRWSTPGPYSRTFVFLVYINNLTENLKCNVKLFADDTSLFTVVENSNAAANDMNHDLELIMQWAHDWRMSFNPDPLKQAVELIFSTKKTEVDHPAIFCNNVPVKKVDEHKHLGIVLDSKLSFSAHIRAAISKTRKSIGLL